MSFFSPVFQRDSFWNVPQAHLQPCVSVDHLSAYFTEKEYQKNPLNFLLTKYRLTYFHPRSYYSLLLHFLFPSSHSHTLSPKESASLAILPIFYFFSSLDLHLFLYHFLVSEFIHGSILAKNKYPILSATLSLPQFIHFLPFNVF